MNKLFITTTLPYCNGEIHVGAAFEFILADFLKRYFLSKNKEVILNIGLDQTGSKILGRSKELNLPVDEYIKQISSSWKSSVESLGISYDVFYETYTEQHETEVKKYWKYFLENGDIFQKQYRGCYCKGCEAFKLEKDLIDGRCQDHPLTPLESVDETNYFFGFSKYKDLLLKWLENNPITERDKNELLTFINDYDDISISRNKSETTFDIEVPSDSKQIIYVWFSALLNYIIAAERFAHWNDFYIIQLCGRDNLRFQAQIWQNFLLGLNKKNTDKIIVHGTILDKKFHKMSKTLGNVVSPNDQIEKYGLLPFKYYLLSKPTYEDFAYSEEELILTWNNLNDILGNLHSRLITLIQKYSIDIQKETYEGEYQAIDILFSELKISDGIEFLNSKIKAINKYLTDTEPWKIDDEFVRDEIINRCWNHYEHVIHYYCIILPEKTDIFKRDYRLPKIILFEKIK